MDEFIGFSPSTGPSDSFFMHNFDVSNTLKKIIQESNVSMGPSTTLFMPRRIGNPPHTHYTNPVTIGSYKIVPEYYMYGESADVEYDYVFHIRNRQFRQDDNWNINNWVELRKLLGPEKKIACIGTKNQAGTVDDADDLRDIPLRDTCNLIKNCGAVFGPSSGPMHLASLCGTPHVVWQARSIENYNRYTQNWNPFNTPILYLNEHGWRAPPLYIYERFLEWEKSRNA